MSLRNRLGGLTGRIGGARFRFEEDVRGDPRQRAPLTAEQAKALIDERASELVENTIATLEADRAVELAQADPAARAAMQPLLTQLATTMIRADLESVYAQIYGSQIAALRTLRAAPDGATRESLEPHLAQVKSETSMRLVAWLQNLTFEGWVDYLVGNGLVETRADERYRITTRGVGFLGYIDGAGYAPKRF